MANLPVYILDPRLMPLLKEAMQEVSISLQETGPLKEHAEGIEQNWKCFDKSGDLFYFGTVNVNARNGLHLEAGTFCLIPGPSAPNRRRKDIAEAYQCFERALLSLGVKQMLQR